MRTDPDERTYRRMSLFGLQMLHRHAHALYTTASSDNSEQDERIRLQQFINERNDELKETKKRAKYDL